MAEWNFISKILHLKFTGVPHQAFWPKKMSKLSLFLFSKKSTFYFVVCVDPWRVDLFISWPWNWAWQCYKINGSSLEHQTQSKWLRSRCQLSSWFQTSPQASKEVSSIYISVCLSVCLSSVYLPTYAPPFQPSGCSFLKWVFFLYSWLPYVFPRAAVTNYR